MNNSTATTRTNGDKYYVIPLEEMRAKAIELIHLYLHPGINEQSLRLSMFEHSDEFHSALKDLAIANTFGLCRYDKRGEQKDPIFPQPYVYLESLPQHCSNVEQVIYRILDLSSEFNLDPESIRELSDKIVHECMNLVTMKIHETMGSDFPHADNIFKVQSLTINPKSDICIAVVDEEKQAQQTTGSVF